MNPHVCVCVCVGECVNVSSQSETELAGFPAPVTGLVPLTGEQNSAHSPSLHWDRLSSPQAGRCSCSWPLVQRGTAEIQQTLGLLYKGQFLISSFVISCIKQTATLATLPLRLPYEKTKTITEKQCMLKQWFTKKWTFSPSGHPRLGWVCFFIRFVEMCLRNWLPCSEWVPSGCLDSHSDGTNHCSASIADTVTFL